MTDIPQEGEPITPAQVEMFIDAMSVRRANFPDEPAALTIMLVLMNLGERFTPVTCAEGEWSSIKRDLIPSDGPPACPNGHYLMEGSGITLGWVAAG